MMISVIDTVNNLLELISTSPMKPELLEEMVNIVGSYFSETEHTIFCLDARGLRIVATTLAETAEDERIFLERLVRNHYSQEQDLSSLRTTTVRDGIEKMYAYPLRFGGAVIGLWLIEYYIRPIKKTIHESAIIQAMGIALGSYMITREANWNLYLDPITKLPGKYYFSLIVDGLTKRDGEGFLCIINPTKLETDYQRRNKQMKTLCTMLNNLQLGMSYRIEEDIFSLITYSDRVKVFDKMSDFIDINAELGIKGTLIPICSSNEFFQQMGEILRHCEPGKFGAERQKKPYQKPRADIRKEQPVTGGFDVLQMLQEDL